MDVAEGIAFLGAELLLIVLALFALVRTGFARLDSSIGILRDGLPPGKAAPSWSLPDFEGRLRVGPAGDHWQLLIFADHSLASFPHLVTGMNELAQVAQNLEVLVLSRDNQQLCEMTIRTLDLQVPIVRVDQEFYDRFRVRVIPFAFFLDPGGIVRWIGLVNTSEQLSHAWRTIQATLPGDGSKGMKE